MYRNLVVGLLRNLPGPVALFGLDGRILGSTFEEGADSQLAALSEEIPGPESVRDPDGRDVVFENEAVNVTLLRGPSERPLAWLARAKPAAGR